MDTDQSVFAVITGGGTSGHVIPALALAEILIDAGHSSQNLHIIGTTNGIETKLVPPTRIPISLLDVRGFSRKVSLSSLRQNISALKSLRIATRQAVKLLLTLKPKVVISVGGYGSVAASRAATKLGIPFLTVSYDRLPGLATRLQSRKATATAVAYLPTKLQNAILTGAPVRRALRTLDIAANRAGARERLGLSAASKVIAVTGGSLGSAMLNAVTRQLVEDNSNREDLCVIHLTGERYIKDDLPQLTAGSKIKYQRLASTIAMEDLYAASDLLVSRAGASTIAELATVGCPSVLIPWRQSAENHQFFNAKWLGDLGGAVVLEEGVYSQKLLAEEIVKLIDDSNKLSSLAKMARVAGTVHRESKLSELIASIASATNSSHLDLSSPKRIHIVGVGGPGMSAIATVLAEMGHHVSGSDINESEIIHRLRLIGVKINIGHERKVVGDCDLVTGSPAIAKSNIEYDEAGKRNISIASRGEMLANICSRAKSIGVAGTHGKTTTSSMLAAILIEAKKNPSYLIGGDVADFGRGASWTNSELFVVEADESDSSHLKLPLAGAILTNVDIDHLDNFLTFDAIRQSFSEFVGKVNGPKVLCIDDLACAEIARNFGAITYSALDNKDSKSDSSQASNSKADFVATEVSFKNGSARFVVSQKIDGHFAKLGEVMIGLRGMHNVRNALGALTMAMQLGANFDDASTALSKFGGVARRFDQHGTHQGVTYVDDYAHLPNEISAVLAGARDESDSWSRVVAVFQPNRFNRMSVISHLYADSFVDADLIVITDIYASGTKPIAGITGELVVEAVRNAHPQSNVVYRAQRADLIEFLANELKSGDLCISMGCGDIAALPGELISRRQV